MLVRILHSVWNPHTQKKKKNPDSKEQILIESKCSIILSYILGVGETTTSLRPFVGLLRLNYYYR